MVPFPVRKTANPSKSVKPSSKSICQLVLRQSRIDSALHPALRFLHSHPSGYPARYPANAKPPGIKSQVIRVHPLRHKSTNSIKDYNSRYEGPPPTTCHPWGQPPVPQVSTRLDVFFRRTEARWLSLVLSEQLPKWPSRCIAAGGTAACAGQGRPPLLWCPVPGMCARARLKHLATLMLGAAAENCGSCQLVFCGSATQTPGTCTGGTEGACKMHDCSARKKIDRFCVWYSMALVSLSLSLSPWESAPGPPRGHLAIIEQKKIIQNLHAG